MRLIDLKEEIAFTRTLRRPAGVLMLIGVISFVILIVIFILFINGIKWEWLRGLGSLALVFGGFCFIGGIFLRITRKITLKRLRRLEAQCLEKLREDSKA